MGEEIGPAGLEGRIHVLRGTKVMLSGDLAQLYEVEHRALIQAVHRNIERFPEDFLFRLTKDEGANLKSQIVISSWGGTRTPPYAFTEQGIAMLSGILRSRRAVLVNIAIMRAFVQLRNSLAITKEMAAQLSILEARVVGHDADIQNIFEALRRLMEPPERAPSRIGFTKEGA